MLSREEKIPVPNSVRKTRSLAARLDATETATRTLQLVILVILGLFVCVHLSTLPISPTIWQDETQIVDWGRSTVFEPHTSWSVNMIEGGRSVPMFAYLGPLVQELAYRVLAPNPIGPRLSALVAACLAASCFYLWLRRRGNRNWEALVTAGLLFLEPAFVASYRGARVDALSMAACFGALALLRSGEATFLRMAAAGVGFAGAVFVWPSAMMLAPLVFAELYAVSARKQTAGKRVQIAATLLAVTAGAVVAGLALGGALYWFNRDVFELTTTMVQAQFGLEVQTGGQRLSAFVATTRTSPVSWLAALFLLLRLPERATVVAIVAVLCVLFGSLIDGHRVLYFMPYAALAVAEGLRNCAREDWRARLAPVAVLALVPAALALLLRTGLALDQRVGRDPSGLLHLGQRAIGARPARVYLEPFEFYFVGRQLGWQMLRAYGATDPLAKVFTEVDYAIVHKDGPLAAALLRLGMQPVASMDRVRTHGSLFGALNVGAQPYGDYAVLRASRAP